MGTGRYDKITDISNISYSLTENIIASADAVLKTRVGNISYNYS